MENERKLQQQQWQQQQELQQQQQQQQQNRIGISTQAQGSRQHQRTQINMQTPEFIPIGRDGQLMFRSNVVSVLKRYHQQEATYTYIGHGLEGGD